MCTTEMEGTNATDICKKSSTKVRIRIMSWDHDIYYISFSIFFFSHFLLLNIYGIIP